MNFLELTSSAIRSIDRTGTVVLFPIAAVEQHGPHLPTGTDTIICDAIATAVEDRVSEGILRLPTQWIGASAHHLRYEATLDCPLPTYISLLCETLTPLLRSGFKRFLILNGHGGNIDPMRVALRQLQPEYPQTVLAAAAYWSIANQVIAETLEGADRGVGHACEAETSLIMHLRPELVDQEALGPAENWKPDVVEGMYLSQDMMQRTEAGATGRPDLGTAEKGSQMFEGIVSRVCEAIGRLHQEPIPD